MPLEDLDLEFEDEEELKKKKVEAVHVDVDLEFGVTPDKSTATPQPMPKAGPVSAAAPAAPANGSGAQVKKIEEVRAKLAQARAPGEKAAAVGTPQTGHGPALSGANALQLQPEVSGENLAQLYQLVEDTKFEARVQVAVAQEKAEFMAEILSDAKLMQHQIQQLVLRINNKHADLKPELMAIQKALADFLAKKRR